jgi:seryl-tRNA synthetase
MLDIEDFIEERGGNPEKIRESQRRRHAPVELVDEVIALWQDARKSESLDIYTVSMISLNQLTS